MLSGSLSSRFSITMAPPEGTEAGAPSVLIVEPQCRKAGICASWERRWPSHVVSRPTSGWQDLSLPAAVGHRGVRRQRGRSRLRPDRPCAPGSSASRQPSRPANTAPLPQRVEPTSPAQRTAAECQPCQPPHHRFGQPADGARQKNGVPLDLPARHARRCGPLVPECPTSRY